MSENKSKKPKDNALFQQRLKAWRPVLTLKYAFLFFLILGLCILAIGLCIFFTQTNVEEVSIDYTDCNNAKGIKCLKKNYNETCECTLDVIIKKKIKKPVMVYYGLTGFYQNHRLYIKSFEPQQLMGDKVEGSESCNPLWKSSNGIPYAPCGMMPNSLFNDSFQLINTDGNVEVDWTSNGIALEADKKRFAVLTDKQWNKTVKPPSWSKSSLERSKTAFKGDEELLVWLRPSPLPSFRKLHRLIQHKSGSAYEDGLPAGNYTLVISYNFPVSTFSGRKYFIVTNLSWIGGKNIVMSGLYLGLGSIYILVALVLLVLWRKSTSTNTLEMQDIPLQTKL